MIYWFCTLIVCRLIGLVFYSVRRINIAKVVFQLELTFIV
jgi:hypothetical protein